MKSGRVLIVEFLAVAGLVLVFAALAAWMSIAGIDTENPVLRVLVGAIQTGFGALLALAYAARGVVQSKKSDD